MFKKMAAVSAAAALALTMAGCSSPDAAEEKAADAPEVKEEPKAEAVAEEPAVADEGWSYSGGFVNYCAVIGNADPVNCYVYMNLNVTAKAADGSILASQVVAVPWVAPDDVMPVYTVLTVSEEPAEIVSELFFDEGTKPGNDYTLADIAAENVVDNGAKVTGEFENKTGCDFDNGVSVIAVFKQGGEIVAASQNLDFLLISVENGKRLPFEVDYQFGGIPEHDSVDVYVIPELL